MVSVLWPKALSSKPCLSNFTGKNIFENVHLKYVCLVFVYLFIVIYTYFCIRILHIFNNNPLNNMLRTDIDETNI